MIFVLIFVLFALGANSTVLVNDPYYCFSTDLFRLQIKTFGTVTPYDEVRGYALDLNVSKCKPARFWFQGRHGSRFPSTSDSDNLLSPTDDINKRIVSKFRNTFPRKSTLCYPDVIGLDNWVINPNFTLSTSGALTETGRVELKALAQRYQKAFPSLLPKTYSPSHYYFKRTPVPRTLQSAQAFASGLFDAASSSQVTYDGGSYQDLNLIPFYSCPTWISLITSPIPEVVAFTQGPEYQLMVKEVSEKLGFYGSEQLSSTLVDKLITHCKYEQMYNHLKPSAFCSAFSHANHQVSQYYYDLINYYRSGYGFKEYRGIFENMGCTQVQAMLRFLQSNNPNDQIAKIWLGHDVSLQLVFVSLGLYEDAVPLRANNFAQQSFREWKASLLTPMAGNMAVIRYDCADGNNEVLFLHNELPMQIPGCLPNGVCKLSLILQRYSRFLTADCAAVTCSNIRL